MLWIQDWKCCALRIDYAGSGAGISHVTTLGKWENCEYSIRFQSSFTYQVSSANLRIKFHKCWKSPSKQNGKIHIFTTVNSNNAFKEQGQLMAMFRGTCSILIKCICKSGPGKLQSIRTAFQIWTGSA